MDEIYHDEFVYVYIPFDINAEVEEVRFNGLEKEFRERLIKHFSVHSLLPDEIKQLHKQYSKETNGEHQDLISECISTSNTYQVCQLMFPIIY